MPASRKQRLSVPPQRDQQLVAQACRRIESEQPAPSLDALAEQAELSAWHFHRLFKRVLGVTPKQYADAHRMQRFQAHLQGGAPVTQAIYEAGFGAASRAQAQSLDRLGMSPSKAQRGGKGVSITFGVARSQLGWVVVGATERGVCAIEFITRRGDGEAQLRARFPLAHITLADDGLSALTQQVVNMIDESRPAPNLPLDIQGTAFQQKVWQALRGIPPGATVSYAELARRIGQPTAVRAVARACATNPTAVAVPCHRVVGSNGSLTGYRWGVELKAALLERERG